MVEGETITSEYEEIKKEYEINIDDNKIRIEITNEEITFILMIDISYYKYIKKYKYNEIIKELNIEYKDIEKLYEYLIRSEYKIIKEKKKIIINNKEITMNQKKLTNEEVIKLLIAEIKNIIKKCQIVRIIKIMIKKTKKVKKMNLFKGWKN